MKSLVGVGESFHRDHFIAVTNSAQRIPARRLAVWMHSNKRSVVYTRKGGDGSGSGASPVIDGVELIL